MTRAEAIEAMKAGKKVRHRYFSHDEFITMKHGLIVEEHGHEFLPNEFWKYHMGKHFENDWEIINDEQ